jgi:hypothetical protein
MEKDPVEGVEGGFGLVPNSELQEWSELPCDTGSERAVLEREFPGIGGAVE